MSKKSFKSHASSSRVSSQANPAFGNALNSTNTGFGSAPSALSYLAEQPDLSSLEDPNVVVQFKNLAKKDSTTKVRALEELQSYVISLKDSHEEVDDGFLITWAKVYPRISIDGFRRVRQLAHSLHGQICVNGGRRVAKYMPSVVGAWFAGSHDIDRVVQRAANEAFDAVFPTAEKRSALPKAYQASILEFCSNAILNESVESLSDERMTKAEDAEAKFARVVSSNVSMVYFLLDQLSATEIHKHWDFYDGLLSAEKLWEFESSKDQAVRRSVFRLLRICLEKHKDLVFHHVDMISNIMLSKQVVRRQSGTATEYSASLAALTAAYPSLWLSTARRKLGVIRLSEFIKAGSQGASEAYWKEVAAIFRALPDDALPENLDAAIELLNSFKKGLTRKEEPRSNVEHAWQCYIEVANRVASILNTNEQEELANKSLVPLVQQYINPMPDLSDWTIMGPKPLNTLSRLVKSNQTLQRNNSSWIALVDRLCEDIKSSASQEAKAFELSQSSISTRGIKWFGLNDHLRQDDELHELSRHLHERSLEILTISIDTLKSHNGQPHGVAKVVEAAVHSVKPWLSHDEISSKITDEFITNEIPRLMFSPSHLQLISILYECDQSIAFVETWNKTLEAILTHKDSDERLSRLQEFLTWSKAPVGFKEAVKNAELQKTLRVEIDQTVRGTLDWDFLAELASAPMPSLSKETADYMLTQISESLTVEATASRSLMGLELLVREGSDQVISSFQNQVDPSLRQNLLLLTESEDEVLAHRAVELNKRVEESASNKIGVEPLTRSTLNVLAKGWYEADSKSLTVETLVELGDRYIQTSHPARPAAATQIIPDLALWADALDPILAVHIPEPLVISTQLGGTLFLIDPISNSHALDGVEQYDRDGYSTPLRMALYTVNIVENESRFEILDQAAQAEVFRLLLLTVQLVNDNISITGSNNLWSTHDILIEDEMRDFVLRTDLLFKRWLQHATDEDILLKDGAPKSFVGIVKSELWKRIKNRSTVALRHARAFTYVVSEDIELHGWKPESENYLESLFKQLRHSDNDFMLMALAAAFKAPLSNTQVYRRTCNELVANLTGISSKMPSNDGLKELILLDILFEGQEQIIESIAKQRIIFFVKQLVSWLQDGDSEDSTKAEVCRLLKMMLPAIKDVYGTHWSEILDFLVDHWSDARLQKNLSLPVRLGFEMTSLQLLSKLQMLLLDEETVEDLRDSWQDSLTLLVRGVIGLLERLNVTSDSLNEPLRMVNQILGRIIAKLPVDHATNFANLYSLIAVDSISVQRTAFDIMHKKLPKIQEQVSLDTAIENRVARLPEELLSLIIDCPPSESLEESTIVRSMPPSIRGFLSSWLLVFDHFKNASDKVRNDYTTQLKEGSYLKILLDFMSEALGHSRGRPVDVSKFDITVYSFDIEESPVRDLQWLLAHLYFCCLKRTPAITKSWWIECKSRQTVVSVESWTAKFVRLLSLWRGVTAITYIYYQISPHLISDALATVNEWAVSQDTSTSESVTVRTNTRAKEVVVSKDVDEQVMSMVIRLPDNFPLGQAVLHGINRVAVDEKKWRSWLLNSQGVITFSNNSLIDGIIAFRRNVVGALKGQTECAICYSIVGADKQLPTKKCGTCSNLFHGSCLFRWFKTSNSSSCPLCRNAFNYS